MPTSPANTREELFKELAERFPDFKSDWQNEPNWINEIGYVVMADFGRYFHERYFQSLQIDKPEEKECSLKGLAEIAAFLNKYLEHGNEDVQTMIQLEILENLLIDYRRTDSPLSQEDYHAMTNILGGEAKHIIEKYYLHPEDEAKKR